MKTSFLILATGLLMNLSLHAQESNISSGTINSPEFEQIVKKPISTVIKNNSITSFNANIEQAGEYYLSCWMLGGKHSNGDYSSYDVAVNGVAVGKVNATKANWQSCKLNTETITLKKGENIISFATTIPEIPNIEFIKLSSTKDAANIPSINYDNRLANIKANSTVMTYDINPIELDTFPTVNAQSLIVDLYAKYKYLERIPLHYTFNTTVYLKQGQNVKFKIKPISGATPILEIFHSTMPETYSWAIYNNSSEGNSLELTIPITGYYKVRARSFQNTIAGIAEVEVGSTKYSEIPIYSFGMLYTHDTEREYNTFTSNLIPNINGEGDPILYIGTDFPDKIIAYNDDYSGDGDFDWGYNSRIKKKFSAPTKSLFLSNLSSYEDNKPHCDLYIGCWNSTAYIYFPELHSDDAIQSAPYNAEYNCISWSGGITDYWEWPLNPYSQYYVSGNDLASFDMFYLTPRYNGCGIYSRNGATEANSVVDLWGFSNGTSEVYTHASIKHGADNHPHGYDWESKPGKLARTFHPRYALEGNDYGEVIRYYRLIGTGQTVAPNGISTEQMSVLSLDESIAEGLSVLENVEFTNLEWALINAEIENIGTTRVNEFETKYQAWVATWEDQPYSAPESYKNNEYNVLKSFCASFYESRFLIFKKLGLGDVFNLLLLEDLTLTNNVANNTTLNNIKANNSNNATTEEGAAIVYSPYSNSMKYVKALLNVPSTRGANSTDNGIRYSNSDDFSVSMANNSLSVSFDLPKEARISLSIVDLQGRLLTNVFQNKTLEAGNHNYHIEKPAAKVCLVRYSVNGNLNVKKVFIK